MWNNPSWANKDGLSPHSSIAHKRLAETQKEYGLALVIGDSLKIAEMIYILGKRYVGIGNYYTARKLFSQSLGMRMRGYGTFEDIAKIYTRICELEGWQQNPNGVINNARLAISYYNKVKSVKGTVNSYRMIAGSHGIAWRLRHKKQKLSFTPSLDSAFYYYYKALDFEPQHQLPIDMAVTYECLAQLWLLKNDIRQSISYCKKALKIYQREKLYQNAISVSVEIAKSLLKLDQVSEAKEWLYKAEQLSLKIGGVTEQGDLETETVNALYYQKTGQWAKAFEHQSKSHALEIKKLESFQEGVNESIRIELEGEKKDAELKEKNLKLIINEQNSKLHKYLITVIAMLLGITAVAGFVFYRRATMSSQLVREQSHRIKNNLQSLSDLLNLQLHRLSDPVAITAITESLSRVDAMSLIHRDLSYGDKLLFLEAKLFIPDLVRNILTNYDMNWVKIELDIDQTSLHVDQAILLSLLINELLTNSCKYALSNQNEASITLICFKRQNNFHLTFQDSGEGFVVCGRTGSFGMKLIKTLVQQLKGSHSFSSEKGSRFTTTFKLLSNSKVVEKIEHE